MQKWIDRDAALALLRVKPQTLYAYVSRGRIRMEPDPLDARRSHYSAEDVAQLAGRRARGRKPAAIAAGSMAWGEPAIATSLSTAFRGRLFYRGQDAVELAQSAKLEQVAALLWDCPGAISFESAAIADASAFDALAAMIPTAQPILGRGIATLASDATAIIGTLASACGATPGKEPVHLRLAKGWGCDLRAADKLRQALVVMADHDLNASTFAVRVAASTGASLAASVLAGLCALSGPRHGGAAAALASLIADARKDDIDTALDRWLDRGVELAGFGHPLYPGGDPRASLLLDGIELDAFMARLSAAVLAKTGLPPNCDFGLAAMTATLGLPPDAPFRLFLIGRSVGWCAHAMEQSRSGQLIRPRGRYEGILPTG